MDFPATQVMTEEDDAASQYETRGNEAVASLRITDNSAIHLIHSGTTLIGRHPACKIVLTDETVSKKHASITDSEDGKLFIQDHGSSNKTRINNKHLTPQRLYLLSDGDNVTFGKVHAKVTIFHNTEDSIVSCTPQVNRRAPFIVPSTPDSSTNVSSISAFDDSMIPGTQTEKAKSVFRPPMLPSQKASADKEKINNSTLLPAKLDMDDLSLIGVTKADIHELVTQRFSQVDEDTNIPIKDIYDQETQHIDNSICIRGENNKNVFGKELNVNSTEENNINDMETQHCEGVERPSESGCTNTIQDVETQRLIDAPPDHSLSELETQEIFKKPHDNNSFHDLETQQLVTESSLGKQTHNKAQCLLKKNMVNDEIYNLPTQRPIIESDEISNLETQQFMQEKTTESEDSGVHSKSYRSSEVLSLKNGSTADSNCSLRKPLDSSLENEDAENVSVKLVDNSNQDRGDDNSFFNSQNLLDGCPIEYFADEFDDNVINEVSEPNVSKSEDELKNVSNNNKSNVNVPNIASKNSDSKISTTADDDSETDEEGIFEDNHKKKLVNKSKSLNTHQIPDSDTDEEDTFKDQPNKRKVTNEKVSKHEIPDSDTDEEGIFENPEAKDLKENKTVCDGEGAYAEQSSKIKEPLKLHEIIPDSDSDTDEEGIFENPSDKENANIKPIRNTPSPQIEDMHDASTQLITNMPENEPEKLPSKNSKSDEDSCPTQIIDKSVKNSKFDNSSRQNVGKKASEKADDLAPTEIVKQAIPEDLETKSAEDIQNASTQIIDTDKSNKEDVEVDVNNDISRNASIEDLEYEMASTQVIGDIESAQNVVSNRHAEEMEITSAISTKKKSKRSVNLNDTIERNLNEMFDSVHDETIDAPPRMYTQQLEDILELTQHDENVDKENDSVSSPARNRNFQSSRKTPTRGKKLGLRYSLLSKVGEGNKSPDGTQGKSVNLNDTVERNLNEMFDDVYDSQDLPEEELMLTQQLASVLDNSQKDNAEEDDKKSSDNSPGLDQSLNRSRSRLSLLPKMSPKRETKVDTLKTQSTPKPSTSSKSRSNRLKRDIVTDSPDTDEYFKNLRTRKNRSFLNESENDEVLKNTATTSRQKREIVHEQGIIGFSNGEAVDSAETVPALESPSGKNVVKSRQPSKVRKNNLSSISNGLNNFETSDDSASPLPNDDMHKVSEASKSLHEDNDDDFFAGLPEVSIPNTLHCPARLFNVQACDNDSDSSESEELDMVVPLINSIKKTLYGMKNSPFKSTTKIDENVDLKTGYDDLQTSYDDLKTSYDDLKSFAAKCNSVEDSDDDVELDELRKMGEKFLSVPTISYKSKHLLSNNLPKRRSRSFVEQTNYSADSKKAKSRNQVDEGTSVFQVARGKSDSRKGQTSKSRMVELNIVRNKRSIVNDDAEAPPLKRTKNEDVRLQQTTSVVMSPLQKKNGIYVVRHKDNSQTKSKLRSCVTEKEVQLNIKLGMKSVAQKRRIGTKSSDENEVPAKKASISSSNRKTRSKIIPETESESEVMTSDAHSSLEKRSKRIAKTASSKGKNSSDTTDGEIEPSHVLCSSTPIVTRGVRTTSLKGKQPADTTEEEIEPKCVSGSSISNITRRVKTTTHKGKDSAVTTEEGNDPKSVSEASMPKTRGGTTKTPKIKNSDNMSEGEIEPIDLLSSSTPKTSRGRGNKNASLNKTNKNALDNRTKEESEPQTDKEITKRIRTSGRRAKVSQMSQSNDSTDSDKNSSVGETSRSTRSGAKEKNKTESFVKDTSTTSNMTENKGRASRSKSTKSTDSSQDDTTTENNGSKLENAFEVPSSRPKRGRIANSKKPVKHNSDDASPAESDMSPQTSSQPSTPTMSRRSLSALISPAKTVHKVLFTGEKSEAHRQMVAKLGGSETEDPKKCTILVTDKVRRTFKFLCSMALAIPIVSIEWLIESSKASRFLDWEGYLLKDPISEAKFQFRLKDSLQNAKTSKQQLLEGYTIVLTPNVSPPPIAELKNIIQSCGGKALVRAPAKWAANTVVVSREEDLQNAKKFTAKAPKTVTVQSTEFILTGILRHKLDFEKFRLSV